MANTKRKFSRSAVALFWSFAVVVILGVLIYLEQIALLYVLTTISLVILLLTVGFADLEKVSRENIEGFAEDLNKN